MGWIFVEVHSSNIEWDLRCFEVDTESRHKNEENCRSYIQRFLVELDRRFRSSRLQEDLSVLFDPAYLQKNANHVSRIGYGRDQLNSLSKRYRSLAGFDSLNVINEWESMRPSLASYIAMEGRTCPRKEFWKEFIVVQQVICNSFVDDYRNVMLLMNTYLISPTNSAECERGFSASNRIQTNGRSRLMIDTLNALLTVRLLLPEDIRRYEQDAEKKLIPYCLVISSSRCHQVIEKTFNLWNDSDENRRWRRTTLIIDVPDDYEPARQTRPNRMKRIQTQTVKHSDFEPNRPKRPKATAVRCANGCPRVVSHEDPFQNDAIQCCHSFEFYSWIDDVQGCSRWLCNYCRIKLSIPTDSTSWFCSDHVDMHREDDASAEESSKKF
jgi:hypothetical protein